jgi:hypothetical protein
LKWLLNYLELLNLLAITDMKANSMRVSAQDARLASPGGPAVERSSATPNESGRRMRYNNIDKLENNMSGIASGVASPRYGTAAPQNNNDAASNKPRTALLSQGMRRRENNDDLTSSTTVAAIKTVGRGKTSKPT